MEMTLDPKREARRVCNRIGLALFTMMATWLVVLFAAQFIVAFNAPQLLENIWVLWLLNDLPLYGVAVPIFLLMLRFMVPDGPAAEREKVPFGPGKYVLLLIFCFGASYLMNYITIGITALIQTLLGSESIVAGNESLTEMATMGGVLPNLLFGAVVPAIGEEFLFRYMLRRKMNGSSDATYIVFSGICFAVFHGNLSQMLYAFVLGVAFAWVYAVTGKLWIPMSLHFAINLVGIVISPMLIESVVGMAIFGFLILLLVPTAIVFFFVFRRWAFSKLRPPHEAGWPYKPPKPKAKYHVMGQPVYDGAAAPYGYPGPGAYPQQAAYGYPQQVGYNYPPPAYYYPQYPQAVPPMPPVQPAVESPPPEAPAPPVVVAAPAVVAESPAVTTPPRPEAGAESSLSATLPPEAAVESPAVATSPQPETSVESPPSATPPPDTAAAPVAPPPAPGYAYPPVYYPQPAYYYYPQPAAWQPKPKSVAAVCYGNVGMVLYLVLAGLMTLFTLLGTLVL